MRPAAFLFLLASLGATGAGTWELARRGVAEFERASTRDVTDALADAGQAWSSAQADGLTVTLSGEAPDEAARVRATAVGRAVVGEDRILDLMTVRAGDPVTPPDFSLAILRDEDRVSLVGLVPAQGGRAAIRAGLDEAGIGGTISDMLQTADQPMPAGWTDSLALGLRALRDAPHSKVTVAPGQVRVAAAVESDLARRALEAGLRAARPREVTLTLDISAPRPVISPYRLDFVSDGATGHFDACAAETEADADAIANAARPLGLSDEPACQIGLGAPSPDWRRAVTEGLGALATLGGGRFAVKDLEATLTGPAGVDARRLSAIGDNLARALPERFTLTTVAPPRMATQGDGGQVYAPRFTAKLEAGGRLTLDGALRDDTTRAAIESYAAARAGQDRIQDSVVIDPSLPDGWASRVLLGVAALTELRAGTLEITTDLVSLEGTGADATTNASVTAMLSDKLGPQGSRTDLGVAPAPPAEPAPARQPVPEAKAAPGAPAQSELAAHCAEEVTAVLAGEQIRFAAGSAVIDPRSQGTILAIADALRACPGGHFEVGGHTDSQGSAEGNQRLSQSRAEAVAAALGADLTDGPTLVAKGYGETDPVTGNDSEEDRARNRRITFRVLDTDAPDAGQPSTGEDAPAPAPAPRATAVTAPARPVQPAPEANRPAPLPAEGSGDEVDE